MNDMMNGIGKVGTGSVIDKDLHMADNLLFNLEDGTQEWHLLSGRCLVLLPPGEDVSRLYEALSTQLQKLAWNANVDLSFVQFYTVNATGEFDGGLCCWVGEEQYIVLIDMPATRFKLHHFSDAVDSMVKKLDGAKAGAANPDEYDFIVFWMKWMKKWVLTYLPKYLEDTLYHHYEPTWEEALIDKNMSASHCWEIFPGFEDEDVLDEEETPKKDGPAFEIPHIENTEFRDYDFTYEELGLMREFKFDYMSRVRKIKYDYGEEKDPLMFNLSDEDIVEYWLMGGRCTLVLPKTHDIRHNLWNYMGEELVDKAQSKLDLKTIGLKVAQDGMNQNHAVVSVDLPKSGKYSAKISHKPLECQIGNFIPEAMEIIKPMSKDLENEIAKGDSGDAQKIEELTLAISLVTAWGSLVANAYMEYDSSRAPIQCAKYCHKTLTEFRRKGTAILEK